MVHFCIPWQGNVVCYAIANMVRSSTFTTLLGSEQVRLIDSVEQNVLLLLPMK